MLELVLGAAVEVTIDAASVVEPALQLVVENKVLVGVGMAEDVVGIEK